MGRAARAGTVNGAIKCQQISGGDGYSTMGDGTQTFMFSFGPLSGLADVAAGHPGTEFPNIFNTPYPRHATLTRGDPATTDGAASGASPGGRRLPRVYVERRGRPGARYRDSRDRGQPRRGSFPVTTPPPLPVAAPARYRKHSNGLDGRSIGPSCRSTSHDLKCCCEGPTPTPPGYAGTWTITCVATGTATELRTESSEYAFQYVDTTAGLAADTGNDAAAIASSRRYSMGTWIPAKSWTSA